MSAPAPLEVSRQGATTTLKLARPAARNALDGPLVFALTEALAGLPQGVRRVVLCGEGPAFCAGADLNWMVPPPREGGAAGGDAARALAALFATLDALPQVVVAHAHGAVMGGGVGLLACCDLVVLEASCRLALSEVRLGLVPAIIAPYVVAKIGPSAARRLFVTAAAFGAEEACRLGLAHHVASSRAEALAHLAGPFGADLAGSAPGAVASAKALVREVATCAPALLPEHLEARLRERLASDEARQGVAAFRARRPAPWTQAPP